MDNKKISISDLALGFYFSKPDVGMTKCRPAKANQWTKAKSDY